MDRVILACEMIEDEVRAALAGIPATARPPVVWVESGLHDRPERLNAALQDLVDLLDEGARTGRAVDLPSLQPGPGPAAVRRTTVTAGPVRQAVLALGFCGRGLQGLGSQHVEMVFPRVDDCISLFLNHGCAREAIPRDTRSYYVTRGWFRHDSSLSRAFVDLAERFGPERAATLRRTMFAGYERVSLIDTKAYDVEDCLDMSRAYAAELELEHKVVEGSTQLLRRLFADERDSEIVAVAPGERIGFGHLLTSAGG